MWALRTVLVAQPQPVCRSSTDQPQLIGSCRKRHWSLVVRAGLLLGNTSALRSAVRTERELAVYALALGARDVAGWSPAESALVRNLARPSRSDVLSIRKRIEKGEDPLGEAFAALRSPEDRRPMGATYTPASIVDAMVDWATERPVVPVRVVDPGTGSARFLRRAAIHFPEAALLGVEIDPLAALIARATLCTAGFAKRAEVIVGDYRDLALPVVEGPTLFLGNPPYVRHHLISTKWKRWLKTTAAARGFRASQLAGLHVHFYLATLELAVEGDYVSFITAAEWMDVNYGSLVRGLFAGPLGGQSIHVVEPAAAPFPDAASTAAIACCEIGSSANRVRLKRVSRLDALDAMRSGRLVRRDVLAAAARWTPLTRSPRKIPEGFVELGELCRVHRGQVTGANKVWVTNRDGIDLPESVLFPSITRAKELFDAVPILREASALRFVIDLPVDLDELGAVERRKVAAFLRRAKALGTHLGYIARTRRAWWSVGLRDPAPILVTYMARRPPAFILNRAQARHINIAHGVYPREPLSSRVLSRLARYLSTNISVAQGRTYAGGLTKFEPREIERLLVPSPAMLKSASSEWEPAE